METKTFSVASTIAMVLTMTAAALSIIGITITGLYPAIPVLFLIAVIPIASRSYAKKIITKPNRFQRNYFTAFTVINLLLILAVAWMTFVILVDRVFSKVL